MISEQLQYCKDDVIDVAKPRCTPLFGVVESSCPVYGDVRLSIAELSRSVYGCATEVRAEVPKTVKNWAITANIELFEWELLQRFWCDSVIVSQDFIQYRSPEFGPGTFRNLPSQKVNVIVCVEAF